MNNPLPASTPLRLPEGAAPISLAEAIRQFDPRATHHPTVWVAGELVDVRRARSGHLYGRLVDGDSQIRTVLWERVARGIPVHIHDGLSVAVYGWIQQHPQRTDVELDIRDVIVQSPAGPREGARQALEEALQHEGLFDPARKRALPTNPSCIGIVTSPAGSVIHDIRSILRRRAPHVRTHLAPARVSGEGAAAEIAFALRSLSTDDDVDVVILARGGGSSCDLAAFDSELVARAIAGCRVPVISAVGHETDVTLADLVADIRAATPSEAAEIAAPECRQPLVEVPVPEPAPSADPREFSFRIGGASVTIRLDTAKDQAPREKS